MGVALAASMAVATPARAQDYDDEEEGALTPEQPPVPDITGDISQVSIEELLKIPMVESASRRKQSLHEAPASLSLLRGEEALEASPLNLADALRRVPGVYV